MDENNYLTEFIEKYQQEVSIINETSTEQNAIEETFRKAYDCLSDFVIEKGSGLQFVITPLSTSMLGSVSKGIMIPDVPVGIISGNLCEDAKKGCTTKCLLQNILCYIGIVNNLGNITLSGILKDATKNKPRKLYGYIHYDKQQGTTNICGLDEVKQPNYINWKYYQDEEIINRIRCQYDRSEEFLPSRYKKASFSGKTTFEITPWQYEAIKTRIASTFNILEQEKVSKKTLVFASHKELCEKTNLSTSYYFFNQPFIKERDGSYSNYGNIVITVNEKLTPVWEQILCFFSLQLLSAYRIYYQNKIEFELVCSNIKSAVAALMSRNMSHNLGSHYLTNTKNYFRCRIDDKTLAENVVLLNADYRGAAHLLQYMQERMDFIATIVSTDRYPLGSLNFKAEFFDALTNDDCGERHSNGNKKFEKNFLLQYLLHSEKYTRHGHTCDDEHPDFGDVRLMVQIGDNSYSGLKEKMEEEQGLKMELSKLRMAVPGGIMARHALFTLVENILRNSAKHNKHNESNELILTIKVSYLSKGKCTLSFFDNCKAISNDENVLTLIKKKFDNIKIINLEKNNVIDKTDKGLKEMLICALWLKNKDVARALYNIQIGQDKASNYLRVKNENGNLCYELDLDLFEKFYFIELEAQPNKENNTITLSVDQMLSIHADYVLAKDDYFVAIEGVNDEEEKKKLSDVFPRFRKVESLYYNEEATSEEEEGICVVKGVLEQDDEDRLMKKLLDYKNYEAYKLLIDNLGDSVDYSKCENVWNVHSGYQKMENDDDIIVYLDHYLNGGQDETLKKINAVPNALYVDSISGENFTSTLTTPDFLKDNILRMKVIDSALTRIVLIDERIWENYRPKIDGSSGCSTETMLWQEVYNIIKEQKDYPDKIIWQNIRDKWPVFMKWWSGVKEANMDTFAGLTGLEKLRFLDSEVLKYINIMQKREWQNNDFSRLLLEKKNLYFYSMYEDYSDKGEKSFVDTSNNCILVESCDFLSVHLGLIEKYLENNEERGIKDFLDLLTRCFHPKFISVHSGRGNFSPELEAGLESYPFVSLSAIDAALGNSKYLLSELFNNTNYYGKGNINHNKGI